MIDSIAQKYRLGKPDFGFTYFFGRLKVEPSSLNPILDSVNEPKVGSVGLRAQIRAR